MGTWIDASVKKPAALRAVLAKTDRHKHPIIAYWIPAQTVEESPPSDYPVIYSVLVYKLEGWYTKEAGQYEPLDCEVLGWVYLHGGGK